MKNNEIDVEVKNLTKKFGNFRAVDNVSFSVKRGSFFRFWGQAVVVKPPCCE